MHSTDSIDEAATLIEAAYGDAAVAVAGEGAPLVAEFAVTEFAAAIGLSTDAGKRYVGHALELRHRLPRVWKRVQAGELPAWRGRMIAERTLLLSREAASFVDTHVAATAHKVGPGQLQRLVDEAIGRYMPEEAERRRLEHADGRYFTIETQSNAYDGTAPVHGQLDLPDARDLEHAIQSVAAELKDFGSEETLDVRRSVAVGELARRQLAFDLSAGSVVEEGAPRPSRNHRSSADGALRAPLPGRPHRPPRTRQPADHPRPAPRLVRRRRPGHRETRPRPERPRPGRLTGRTRPARRDSSPSATRPASSPGAPRPARRCDTDHTTPHNRGGPTCPCNEATLCRRHHRIKTHGAWTYTTLEPGTYLWRAHTATSTSATPTAPETSPPNPTDDHPAPHPAEIGGASGVPVTERRTGTRTGAA